MYMQNARAKKVAWAFAVLALEGFEHLTKQDISKAHAAFLFSDK